MIKAIPVQICTTMCKVIKWQGDFIDTKVYFYDVHSITGNRRKVNPS